MSALDTPVVHIVDGDDSLRTALSRLLAACGYQVALYESGARFLERPRCDRPGCILLDVNMPGLSGLQLQQHLAQTQCMLPIIFLTGHGDIAMSVRAIKSGAEDFLSKPVAKVDLLDAIERALQRDRDASRDRGNVAELRQRVASLTSREREVFDMVILGMLNKQIAHALGTAERTVKAHRHNLLEKMQVKSVAELVLIATQLGLVSQGKDRGALA